MTESSRTTGTGEATQYRALPNQPDASPDPRRRPGPAPLRGRVAVVAGATRGAGRGIARMLGEAGATVYCTGRSSRTQPNTSDHHHAARPETIEETAELVTAAGGEGIAVRVEHRDEDEVKALFRRVERAHHRLDVLVNVLTGKPVASWKPFWQQSVEEGRAQYDSWLWPHIVTCRHAVPLMRKRKAGLIVEIIEQNTIGYHGQFFFDMLETSLKRIAYALSEELASQGISAVAITPGFMRTEAILEQFGATEATWRHAAEHNASAKAYGFEHSETPCFVGRGIAALAADPAMRRWSGGVYTSYDLALAYDFDDVDGRRPNMWRYLSEHHFARRKHEGAAVQWVLSGGPDAASAVDAAGAGVADRVAPNAAAPVIA